MDKAERGRGRTACARALLLAVCVTRASGLAHDLRLAPRLRRARHVGHPRARAPPAVAIAWDPKVIPVSIGGIFAGGLHSVTGPDHLAALLPICIGRRWWTAIHTGLYWGLGHGIGAALVGAVAFLIRGALNIDLFSTYMEAAVGISIMVIGLSGIAEAREWSQMTEDDAPPASAAGGDLELVLESAAPLEARARPLHRKPPLRARARAAAPSHLVQFPRTVPNPIPAGGAGRGGHGGGRLGGEAGGCGGPARRGRRDAHVRGPRAAGAVRALDADYGHPARLHRHRPPAGGDACARDALVAVRLGLPHLFWAGHDDRDEPLHRGAPAAARTRARPPPHASHPMLHLPLLWQVVGEASAQMSARLNQRDLPAKLAMASSIFALIMGFVWTSRACAALSVPQLLSRWVGLAWAALLPGRLGAAFARA